VVAPSPPTRRLRWWREPALHVALLGASLFALDAWRRRPAGDAREVVVPASYVRSLRAELTQRHGRPPSAAELQAEVDGFVREEVLYREALALGLDRGDVIVRRRLVQKMEFLVEDLAAPDAPTEAALEAQLRAHPDRYAAPARVSFRHVFFDRGRRGALVDADARTALQALRDGGAVTGDPFALGERFESVGVDRVARDFDEGFAQALRETAPDSAWRGPIASRYGVHLAQVSARSPGELPPLAQVRARVAADLAIEQREGANQTAWRRVAAGYRVRVEGP
jgi:hypothetical protein